jgi:hypothetical protein
MSSQMRRSRWTANRSRSRGAALFVLVLAVAVMLISASPAAAQTTRLRVLLGVSATGPCPPCKYAGGAGVTTGDTVYLKAKATRALPAGARLRFVRVRLDPTSGRRVTGSTRTFFCSVGRRVCRLRAHADIAVRRAYQASVVTPKRVRARSRIVKVVWTGPPKNVVLPRLVQMQRGTGGISWTVTPSSDFSQGSASYLGQSMSWVMPLTIKRGAQGRVNAHVNAGTGGGSTTVGFTSPREFGAHVNGQPGAGNQTVAAAPNGGSASASTTITFDPTRRFTPGERFTIGLQTDGPQILLEYVAK